MKKYYQLVREGSEANIYVYGDITSWEWFESDVSSYTLSKEIEGIDVETINVYINSYGGEVSEGLAIYNALKRHKARVKTYCDGFACSAASVVFMAGDERIMSIASLLFIHNAWEYAAGNSNQLRKAADDLDIITQASVNTYLNVVNITKEELKQMLDDETWILPENALEMGFATSIINDDTGKGANQSVRKNLMQAIMKMQQAEKPPHGSADRVQADGTETDPPGTAPAGKDTDPIPPSAAGQNLPAGSLAEKPKENKPIKCLSALMR
jgi:ATP-dependent Clp protease protease subunit